MQTIINEITTLINNIDILSQKIGINNIFYNEKYIEVIIASLLKHKLNNSTQGFDALDENNKPTEYKTINVKNNNSKSYQFHWLSNNKINKYSKTDNIYFVKRNGVKVLEIYKLSTKIIMPFLLDKSTGSISTNGHKSFSHNAILKLGAKLVYKS